MPTSAPTPIASDLPENKSGYFPYGFFVREHRELAQDESHAGHFHYIGHLSVFYYGDADIEYCRRDGSDAGLLKVSVGADRTPIKIPIDPEMVHRITARNGPARFACWFQQQEADKLFCDGAVKGSDGIPWTNAKDHV